MTDLSALFRSKSHLQPTIPFQKASEPKSSYFPTPSPPQRYYESSPQIATSRSNYIISSQVKKIITFNNLQQQVFWFQQNNLLEFLVKILFVGILLGIGYFYNFFSIKLAFIVIIFTFFMLGILHCIFGDGLLRKWAFYSLIGTTLVLVNHIFFYLADKINHSLTLQLYQTYQSLIPALYITVLLTIFLNSLPILPQTITSNSILKILQSYPKSLLQLTSLFYKLKIVILQIYSLMFIGTFFISLILLYKQKDWNNVLELIQLLINPVVLLAQFGSFWLTLFIMHFIINVVGYIVDNLAIKGFFQYKNPDTKIPYMLQLLRVSPNDVFGPQQNITKQPTFLLYISKLLKFDLTYFKAKQTKMNRQQIQNIYKHSLRWLIDMLYDNPNILNTKINTSKFYNNYFDIFKEFAEIQLRYCSNELFYMEKNIENFSRFKSQEKSLKQDLFFWVKILKRQFQLWKKAVECCRLLSITDLILQTIHRADVKEQLWQISSIGRAFKQISQRTNNLSQSLQLNPSIRDKMSQYYNKTTRLFKK